MAVTRGDGSQGTLFGEDEVPGLTGGSLAGSVLPDGTLPEGAGSDGAQDAEGRTQVYRPRADETARRARPALVAPVKSGRSVPLLLVLLGFLLVGFVVVAGLMVLVKR